MLAEVAQAEAGGLVTVEQLAGGLRQQDLQAPMVGQGVAIAVPELVQQPRRALDVGEQQRDGPAGKVRHERLPG